MFTSDYFASSYFAPRYFANNLYSPVGKSVQHLWNVKSVIGKSDSLLWKVHAAVGLADQFLWFTKAIVGDTTEYVWNTLEVLHAGNECSLIWGTRQLVQDNSQAVWNTHALVGNASQEIWQVKVPVGDETSSIWNIRSLVGNTSQEIWDVEEIGDVEPEEDDNYTSRFGITRSRFSNFVLGLNEFNTTGNKSLTLYIRGTTLPGNMFAGYDPLFTLYELGHDTASLSTTLFIGETPNKSLNLFLRGEDPYTETSSLNLFVFGSTSDNAMFAGITLHTYSDADGNKQERSIPLFMQGSTESSDDRTLNLWISGEPHTASASIDFYIENNQLGASASVTLFIQGEGTSEGATPTQAALNLWLQRDPTAMLNLYISGPGEVISQDITLFIEGSIEQTSSINLSIPDVVGYSESTVVLYTHGF